MGSYVRRAEQAGSPGREAASAGPVLLRCPALLLCGPASAAAPPLSRRCHDKRVALAKVHWQQASHLLNAARCRPSRHDHRIIRPRLLLQSGQRGHLLQHQPRLRAAARGRRLLLAGLPDRAEVAQRVQHNGVACHQPRRGSLWRRRLLGLPLRPGTRPRALRLLVGSARGLRRYE